MPVVVTGAAGQVGRALVRVLLERGGEVRAVVRRPEAAEELRSLGAKAGAVDLDDTGLLATVMADAHTVCHLVGGLDLPDERAYEVANLGSTVVTLKAARKAGVARLLFLSYPGASATSANAYLRAKGLAEEAIGGSGLEHAIIRSTHVYGPASPWLEEMSASAGRLLVGVVGPGTQRLAPVFVDDVARALSAADDRAGRVSGTWGLQGPEVVTADEMIDLLAGKRRRKLHLTPEGACRAGAIVGRRWSLTLLEVLAADSLADAQDAAADFGLRLTRLADGLRASRAGW